MGSYARDVARDRIVDLAGAGHDLITLWREATDAIAAAVPYYLTPCFYTLDPASLLATSHYHDGLPEIPREWLTLEYLEPDYNKMSDVARSERGIATQRPAATSPAAPSTDCR